MCVHSAQLTTAEAHGRRPTGSLWKGPQRAKLEQPRKLTTLLWEDSPIPNRSCGKMNGHRRVSTPPPGPDGRVLGKALDEPTRISPGTENLQTPSNDHLELRATSEAGETRIEMTDGYSTPLSGSSLPLRPLHAHPFISALFPKSNSDRGVQG